MTREQMIRRYRNMQAEDDGSLPDLSDLLDDEDERERRAREEVARWVMTS